MAKSEAPSSIYPFVAKPALSMKEQLAAGPRFDGEPGICVACGEPGPVDRLTKLERRCWRAWRFSPLWSHEIKKASCGHPLHPRGFGCTQDGCANDSRQFEAGEPSE